MNIFIILPTQLFEFNDKLNKMDKIYLIEEPFYFTSKKFHKQKLILHRSSMKYYYDKLKIKYNSKVIYIEFDKIDSNEFKNKNIFMYDPIDKLVIEKYMKLSLKIVIYDTPLFLETRSDLEEYRNKNTNKKNYYHDNFYKWQRKRLEILIENREQPIGGKWSFDKENRNPYDKNYKEDKIITYSNKYIEEAKDYIKKNFMNNFGIVEYIYYPITHEEARTHLKTFIKKRLETFGKNQDGISKKVIFGSHSILSPLLNIGLITPNIVIDEVIKYYNSDNKLLISVEAFIRQLIGWRSYTRFIYEYHGNEMIKMNRLNHKKKLPRSWYNNEGTNMRIIDDMIAKVSKYGYLHHIERLMIMGNIGLLLEINPKELYDWFMICFIDSYEWVMVPNVYGMSQYSIINISMMTRPYISSSNYIKKMSDYKKEDWYEIWDALYWNFINEKREILKKIYAMAMQVKLIDKMEKGRLAKYLTIAKEII
jgi:deoxyribodipyrimidine photolyase-related protein